MRDFSGAVVMVSHDRYLLDETVGAIAEVDRGRVRMWPGNYSAYHAARELELAQQQTAVGGAAEGDRAARGRDPPLQAVGEHGRRPPPHDPRPQHRSGGSSAWTRSSGRCSSGARSPCALRSQARGGKRVAEWRGASVAFDAEPVLIGVDLTVFRGERVGVIGDNGSGKSVLVKLLAGELEPAEGEIWVGPSIEVGFLPQEHAPAPGRPDPGGRAAGAAAVHRGGGRVGAAAVPVQLRAVPPAGERALRRRAHAARAPAADARAAPTAWCWTSRPTTSTSTRSRCSRRPSRTFDGTVRLRVARPLLPRPHRRPHRRGARRRASTASEGGYSTWYARRRRRRQQALAGDEQRRGQIPGRIASRMCNSDRWGLSPGGLTCGRRR